MAEQRRAHKAGAKSGQVSPPAVAVVPQQPTTNVFERLRSSASASRFSFVRSELATPFTWGNPLVSGASASVIGALFLAHVALGFSIASIVSQVAVIALVVAAAIHLHNSLQPHAALPQLALPLDRASVSQLGVLAADRLNIAIERANAILSWEHPVQSGRALAYAWLAVRFAWLAAPGWIFTAVLLAFIATPAYLQFQRLIDALLDEKVAPVVHKIAMQIVSVEAQASSAAAANATTAALAAGAAGVISLWLFWGVFSFSGMFTLLSLAVAARDVIVTGFSDGVKRE